MSQNGSGSKMINVGRTRAPSSAGGLLASARLAVRGPAGGGSRAQVRSQCAQRIPPPFAKARPCSARDARRPPPQRVKPHLTVPLPPGLLAPLRDFPSGANSAHSILSSRTQSRAGQRRPAGQRATLGSGQVPLGRDTLIWRRNSPKGY